LNMNTTAGPSRRKRRQFIQCITPVNIGSERDALILTVTQELIFPILAPPSLVQFQFAGAFSFAKAQAGDDAKGLSPSRERLLII
jgi:hypothetical protein